ncbi:hypothetical protein BJY01DRAFT_229028 [Aspergillus pseudoustus]|uniref:Uncharacterized protein n=1 Tax=Aspergillus pseudoustus TaxID=1810923 RepID=A0ABR4IIQ8_9EURO
MAGAPVSDLSLVTWAGRSNLGKSALYLDLGGYRHMAGQYLRTERSRIILIGDARNMHYFIKPVILIEVRALGPRILLCGFFEQE